MRNPPHNTLAFECESQVPADTTSPRHRRFTRDGSAALERRLEQICHQVLARIRQLIPASRLEAVLLAGGYGRGEGGVLRSAGDEDQPYNDLEFYVCARGSRFLTRAKYKTRLHSLALELTAEAGIDVEFEIISLDLLRRARVSMFYYDLMSGHRWLLGDEPLLAACQHLRASQAIPMDEATRLLMNRGTGLLLAGQKLSSGLDSADADFVERNIAKAQLALGDAVLTSFGQYHWSCLERAERLQRFLACRNFEWGPLVGRHHTAGVAFKLHPRRTQASAAELRTALVDVTDLAGEVWLWLESRRLGRMFVSLEEYAFTNVNKCGATRPWQNCVLNLAAFRSPLRFWNSAGRHPRERLFNALTLLLWSREVRERGKLPDGRVGDFLRHCLSTSARDWAGLQEAYLKLWRRFR